MANEYAHLTLTDLLLHPEDRDKKNLFILYLFGVSIFLKKIDTPKLRIFCIDLYQLLLITSAMSLPGALISAQPFTPSSLTLFEGNAGDFVGELSESGLEADNKFMKAIHTSKISEEACQYDTVSRMWDQSNPYINSFQPVTHPLSPAFKGTKEGADPLEDRINDLDFT